MGLLKKLLGGTATADEAMDALKNAAKNVMNEVEKVTSGSKPQAGVPNGTVISSNQNAAPAAPSVIPEASGLSWGPNMPEEENQYSYPGTYRQYFSELFASAFPEYRIEQEEGPNHKRMSFTFWQGDRKALVVEVLSQSCSVYKLRRDCRSSGIPYLRFYHDHDGWWNTRSYVTERVRNALG